MWVWAAKGEVKKSAKKSAKKPAKKSAKPAAAKRKKAPHALRAGEKVLATGLPPIEKGTMHFQLGDRLVAKKLSKGGKKGRKVCRK